jgi:hypothetical protein
MTDGMTAKDRNALIRIVRSRTRLAKTATTEREKILRVEIEEQLQAEFRLRDEVRAEVVQMAEEALRKVNEEIRQQAVLLGYDVSLVPQASLPYRTSYEYRTPEAVTAARKRADTRLAALRAAAVKGIEERSLAVEESLIVGGLESDEAKALVESMPTAEKLMPALSLADLGVKTWQPSRAAAKELLAIPSGADRRRKLVARAIAADPDASNRQLAAATGFDAKTVAKYRAELDAGSRELAAGTGEFPAADEDDEEARDD